MPRVNKFTSTQCFGCQHKTKDRILALHSQQLSQCIAKDDMTNYHPLSNKTAFTRAQGTHRPRKRGAKKCVLPRHMTLQRYIIREETSRNRSLGVDTNR